jgi:hypothetical protein
MENLIKIQPDKERARSLVKLAKLRFDKIKTFDEEKESSLVTEGYYEVCKELITAILFIKGHKTFSHKDLIEYLSINFREEFSVSDISLLDQLRKFRNKIVYYGVFIEPSYLSRNSKHINETISKLFKLNNEMLK